MQALLAMAALSAEIAGGYSATNLCRVQGTNDMADALVSSDMVVA